MSVSDLWLKVWNHVPYPLRGCPVSVSTRIGRPRYSTPWRGKWSPCFRHNQAVQQCCRAVNGWIIASADSHVRIQSDHVSPLTYESWLMMRPGGSFSFFKISTSFPSSLSWRAMRERWIALMATGFLSSWITGPLVQVKFTRCIGLSLFVCLPVFDTSIPVHYSSSFRSYVFVLSFQFYANVSSFSFYTKTK